MRLSGKSAIVTGGASGFGAGIVRRFVAEGARVVIADINGDAATAMADELGSDALGMKVDVTNADDVAMMVDTTIQSMGGIDILVNNAGIAGPTGPIEDCEPAAWRRTLAVNLDAAYLCCRQAVPLMKAQGSGSIVNISSIAAIVAGHNMAAYNSAKAAVRHLTKSVALHCAKQGYGIRCNSVHPAFVRTPILDPLVARFGAEEAYAKLGRQIPLGRIGEPEEVAYGVLYLASDESSFMTGAELVLDGGLSAQ